MPHSEEEEEKHRPQDDRSHPQDNQRSEDEFRHNKVILENINQQIRIDVDN